MEDSMIPLGGVGFVSRLWAALM